MLLSIAYKGKVYDIPPSLIIMMDETFMWFVPMGK
jgi:hypothetical protein